MWNILIVLIITIIIWALNPLAHLDSKSPIGGVSQKTKDEVNQIQNEAQQQVDYARKMQKQQEKEIINN